MLKMHIKMKRKKKSVLITKTTLQKCTMYNGCALMQYGTSSGADPTRDTAAVRCNI